MNKFVVTYIYHEKYGRAGTRVVGVYETRKEARKALRHTIKKITQSLTYNEEFTKISKDDFYFADANGTCNAEGSITECEVGIEYLDDWGK